MRANLFTWGAASGALFLVLVIVGAGLSGDTDLYQDDVGTLLTEVEDNKGLFQAAQVLVGMGLLFFLPLAVAVMYTHKAEDRGYGLIATFFFAIGVTAMLAAAVSGFVLAEVASSFVEASGGLRDAVQQDGELMQNLYIMFFGPASFFPMGLAMAISGWLMLRSAFFARPIAWLTFVVAVGGLSGGFLWPVFILGLLIWTVAVAWTLWRKPGAATTLAGQVAPA
jgi:hypothetical protein